MGRRRTASHKMREHLNKMRIIKRKKLQERRLQRELEERELNNLDQQTDEEDIKLEPEPSESVEGVEEEAPGIKVEASFSVNQKNGGDSISIIRDNGGGAEKGDEPGSTSTAAQSFAPTNKCKQSGARPHNNQSLSFCFVCVKALTSEETTQKVTEAEYMCLLSDMLELPRAQSHQHLQRIGQPGKWIGLCHPCLGLIKEVGRRKIVIAKMEREIKSRQQQIVKKMKGARLSLWRNMGANGNEDDDDGEASKERTRVLGTVKQILDFVRHRKYLLLFAGGDDNPPVSKTDRTTEQGSSCKRKSTVAGGHHRVTDKPLPQPSVPVPKKKGAVIPVKIAKLAVVAQLKTSVNQQKKSGSGKSEVWRDDQEEEAPIFLKHDDDDRMEDEEFAVTDPLAVDDEPDCIVNRPCSVSQSRVYYCSLCSDDDQVYSEEQLKLHTNQVHRPSTPPSNKARPKRQRKPSFSPDSDSSEDDEFEGEEGEGISGSGRKSNNSSMESVPVPVSALSSKGISGKKPSNWKEESVFQTTTIEQKHGDPEEQGPTSGEYDCPNCPTVRDYGISRFAQHLAIHQRRPFRCTICPALFPADEDQMEEHWKQKHEHAQIGTGPPLEKFKKITLDPGGIWKCQRQGCSSGFRLEDERDAHELECLSLINMKITQTASQLVLVLISPEPIHSCQICTKPFRNVEEWRLHRVLHHPDVDRLSCLFCELSFAEKPVGGGVELRQDIKMMAHIRQQHSSQLFNRAPEGRIFDECEECGLVFRSPSQTSAHFLEVHGISKGDKIVSCPLSCGSRSVTFAAMRWHVHNVHFQAGLSVCHVCGKSFKRAKTLASHNLTEHGILPPESLPVHTCPVEGCGYRALRRGDIARHSQMAHGAVRNHICKLCGKGFTNPDKLKRHEHIHENKESRPYQCEICGNSFAVQNYLYIHMRLSHQNRKFPSTNRKRDPKKTSKKAESKNKKMAPSLGNSAAAEAEEQQTNATHPEGNEEEQLQQD